MRNSVSTATKRIIEIGFTQMQTQMQKKTANVLSMAEEPGKGEYMYMSLYGATWRDSPS